jgi:hypothetical protein
MCYFHTKFEVDPIKNNRKIRFLSVLSLGPILTLTFDLDSYHLVWWLLGPRHSYMPTMMILRWKTKNVEFLGKFQFSNSDVTKWRHNVKIFVDLESTHQGLSFEVLHNMVPSILKFDLRVCNFRPTVRSMMVKASRIEKLISWVADHMLLSN